MCQEMCLQYKNGKWSIAELQCYLAKAFICNNKGCLYLLSLVHQLFIFYQANVACFQ